MGVEFQSPEGLMVVSDSESESEGMPSAVGSPGCPPASPSEPGLVSSAGGLGPFHTPPRAKPLSPSDPNTVEPYVEPFDPATSRAFGQPLVCRHAKEYHEFVDGLGLCSPGRWRPEQRGCATGVSPTMPRACNGSCVTSCFQRWTMRS